MRIVRVLEDVTAHADPTGEDTMTDLDTGERAQTAIGHPLQGLSAEEIRAARQLLVDRGLVDDATRFAYLGLEEPAKPDVLSSAPATPSTGGSARSC